MGIHNRQGPGVVVQVHPGGVCVGVRGVRAPTTLHKQIKVGVEKRKGLDMVRWYAPPSAPPAIRPHLPSDAYAYRASGIGKETGREGTDLSLSDLIHI
eukprot:scaffold104438_cov35-Tisochrysis_lutea.AAC.2